MKTEAGYSVITVYWLKWGQFRLVAGQVRQVVIEICLNIQKLWLGKLRSGRLLQVVGYFRWSLKQV